MAKFLVTYSEISSVTYLIEAENETDACMTEIFDCNIHKREIVSNELVAVNPACDPDEGGNV